MAKRSALGRRVPELPIVGRRVPELPIVGRRVRELPVVGRLFQREPSPTAIPVDEDPTLVAVAVEFVQSNKVAEFDPARHETLLDGADEADVFIPACCRTGVDGVCKVDVLEGDVVYLQRPEVAANSARGCMVCIAAPLSRVKIDA